MTVILILASSSPRRRQLLKDLPWKVEIRPADVNEKTGEDETGLDLVRRLAALKALTTFSSLSPAEKREEAGRKLIVGADTVLEVQGHILGKPEDEDQAEKFLRQLRQYSHEVHSGICIVDSHTGQTVAATHTTQITLRDFTDSEMVSYLGTGQHKDKAGAYALQDQEFRPVAKLEGCAASAIGFPLGLFVAICAAVTGQACCRENHCPLD